MANNPLDKVYLTEAQLQTLASGGSITSGSDTYTADEDTLYLTDDVPACLTGPSAPTTSTVGAVGQFFLDTSNSKLYQCTAITEDTSTTPSTFSYTWTAVGGGGSGKYMHIFTGCLGNSGTDGSIFFSYIDTDSTSLSSQASSRLFQDLLCQKLRSLNYHTQLYFLGTNGRINNSRYKGTAYGMFGYNNNVYIMFNYLNPVTSQITIDGVAVDVINSITYAPIYNTEIFNFSKDYISERVIAL